MIHGVLAMLMIAAILAHIYIGSVGMEGAVDAMTTGQVDFNWAREHHSLWVDQELAKARAVIAPDAKTAGAD
jgi:formate dehydrogenase subunit gamma